MDTKDLNQKIESLVDEVKQYNPHAHIDFIKKAIIFSEKIHSGHKRASGEDAFVHCYEIGRILVGLRLDSHTIACGMLHDVFDFNVKPELLVKEFDQETLDLIKSITKLETIDNKVSFEEEEARDRLKSLKEEDASVEIVEFRCVDRSSQDPQS